LIEIKTRFDINKLTIYPFGHHPIPLHSSSPPKKVRKYEIDKSRVSFLIISDPHYVLQCFRSGHLFLLRDFFLLSFTKECRHQREFDVTSFCRTVNFPKNRTPLR
jgi:hypothetical protein